MDEKDILIQTLIKEINFLKERVAELERRLSLNSSNSSKPPSSDGLHKPPSSLRPKGNKPSGGQKGHKGHTLTQISNPDQVVRHRVEECVVCQASLKKTEAVNIIKRQVFDIPEPRIELTEHQAELKRCPCGYMNRAPFPETIQAPVQYGPRVKALAVYLSVQQLIPEDRLQTVFTDLFSLPISTATLASINQEIGEKIAPLQENVLEALKNADVKHLDETGFRIGKKTQWLHVISNSFATHYRAREKRGDLLENLKGVLVHDHWKPYFQLKDVSHALCNAHHLRELKALEDFEKEPWAFKMSRLLCVSSRLKDPPTSRILNLYDQIVAEGLTFHEQQPPLGILHKKKRKGHNLALRLRNFKDCVLRFLEKQDVPFTNNQAEQDIRMMKVKQKISGGFRTSQGAEIFCIIRGFISTCRKQGLNLFQSISKAITNSAPSFNFYS